ncbi:MAG: glycine cleavage system protein GcvH [Acidobacteriota bacterium]
MYPKDYLYSNEHEWVKVEGDVAIVGITSFAQNQLGDVVFVELPTVGHVFDAGDEIGTVESVKAVAEIYSPLSGEVVEVNDALADDAEVINEDAHGDGWMVKVRFNNEDELKSLMDAEAYESFTQGD